MTGRTHPSTAGTCTMADWSSRTGRLTRSRAARRCNAATQGSGAGSVPSARRRRAASHPDVSRSDNVTTPVSHSTTIHGSRGSSRARTREASRSTTIAGAAEP